MNKLLMLALLVAVFSIMIETTDAFCGGCGCNVFNCNCDITAQQCAQCPNCNSNIWQSIFGGKRRKRSLVAGEYMDFEAADLDGNGLMDITEFSLAYNGLVYSNKFIGVDFTALDADKDGLISRLESGLDA